MQGLTFLNSLVFVFPAPLAKQNVKYMRFLLFFSLCLGFTFQVEAQKFYGKAVYHSAASLDVTLDSTQMDQGMQDQVQAMMRKAMQKDYELYFDRSTSLYQEQESLDEQGGMGFKMLSSFTGAGGELYKDIKSKELVRQSEFFGKVFLINDTLEDFEWQLVNESKQIGAYTCYKATAVVKALEKSLSMGDEEDEGLQQDSTEITITAWYTPQIPVSTGPDDYHGLPGLILEVNDGTMQMLCTKLILNPKEKVEIVRPTEGEEVTEKEYQDIVVKKVEQMQQMYGGEARKRGSNGGSIQIKVR
jgi:GLPGLI family protein